MTRPPTLVADDGEHRIDAAVDGTRRDLRLSDRAESLLVDDLGYGHADLVPFVVVRALLLAGSASVPGGVAPRAAGWGLSGADGGREPTAETLERTAEHLRAVDIDAGAVETLREHVADTGLSQHVSPDALTSTADRVGGLSDIARDL